MSKILNFYVPKFRIANLEMFYKKNNLLPNNFIFVLSNLNTDVLMNGISSLLQLSYLTLKNIREICQRFYFFL